MAKKGQELVQPSNLEAQVVEESSKRKILAKYVKDNMVAGTDFYTLRMGGRETKPSLSKPGSEKVLSLFHWRAEFAKDDETWEMLGRPSGVICYVCKLYTIKDGVLVGEGRGARDSKKDGNDINKAIKMAEKSAQIDAVLRTGGLSDLFTQDIEDMEHEPPKMTPYRVERAEKVIQVEDPILRQKQTILHCLQELDPTIDIKDGKMVTLEVAARTKLELKENNFEDIIDRLNLLVEELRDGRSRAKKAEEKSDY